MKNHAVKYVTLAIASCAALGAVTVGKVRDAAADPGHKCPPAAAGISAANIYTVTATEPVANNAFAPPLAVACHPGDAVLSGSCTQETDSVTPIAIHESGPVSTHDGWRCTVSNQWSFPATLRATAVCYGTP